MSEGEAFTILDDLMMFWLWDKQECVGMLLSMNDRHGKRFTKAMTWNEVEALGKALLLQDQKSFESGKRPAR